MVAVIFGVDLAFLGGRFLDRAPLSAVSRRRSKFTNGLPFRGGTFENRIFKKHFPPPHRDFYFRPATTRKASMIVRNQQWKTLKV
jgi:hypothetical protein